MPRRVNASQLRAQIRQAQNKQRQAIQRYNNEARRYNSKLKQGIDAYNRAVRSYNARLRSDHSRLQAALRRLAQQPVSVRFQSLSQSSSLLATAYERLDNGSADPFLSDLAERETANSVSVVNALIGVDNDTLGSVDDLTTSKITASLSTFSEDLTMRWSGAIFALNPANPDAARHFCTSSREIITEILNEEAPDRDVVARFPDCQKTERGTPTRRAKVSYCLDRSGSTNVLLEDFVDENIRDLNVLFDDLNSGAHGAAGKYTLEQLTAIKGRVEDSIEFICEIAS